MPRTFGLEIKGDPILTTKCGSGGQCQWVLALMNKAFHIGARSADSKLDFKTTSFLKKETVIGIHKDYRSAPKTTLHTSDTDNQLFYGFPAGFLFGTQ
jgi:hypothetical protein